MPEFRVLALCTERKAGAGGDGRKVLETTVEVTENLSPKGINYTYSR